jgi:DNA-binding transcriptional ArsR family regulator
MTAAPLFPGFDGLMTLSRREGVDIRPTLLRVLTDLYVQARSHSPDEERQFVELTSRLIEQVDDATRAAVRSRLAIYPGTPLKTMIQLGLRPAHPNDPVPLAAEIPAAPAPERAVREPTEAELRLASNLSMQPKDAAEISELFFAAGAPERAQILHNLNDTPLKASARIPEPRARRALHILEMAAFASDAENFALELGEALILPTRIAGQVTNDAGGEPLACAMKALDTPSAIFQRVLLFLNPEFGTSVQKVYRISRLYDHLTERSALVMIAAWRGSSMATARAKYRPALYDDERQRARFAPGERRPAVQPGSAPAVRTGTNKAER